MARSAKEVVNEHFQVKERTLCVCHDQEWRELGRLLQGVRCTLFHQKWFLEYLRANYTILPHSKKHATFLFLPHSDVICDLLLNRPSVARQLGIYLLNLSQMYSSTLGWSIPSSYQPHPFGEDLDHLPYLLTSRFEHFLSFLWKCTTLPWAWQDHLTKTCWGNQLFER